MGQNCNDDLLAMPLKFSVSYSINITRLSAIVPDEKKEQIVLHLFYFAMKLGEGSHKTDWVYNRQDSKVGIINVDFEVKRAIKKQDHHKDDKINAFIKDVCLEMGSPYDYVMSKSKKHSAATVRQLCMFILDKYTLLTSGSIGGYFNRDHSTVLHGIKTINNLIETDKNMRDHVEYIELNIASNYF